MRAHLIQWLDMVAQAYYLNDAEHKQEGHNPGRSEHKTKPYLKNNQTKKSSSGRVLS
jgi:hypothetical protein